MPGAYKHTYAHVHSHSHPPSPPPTESQKRMGAEVTRRGIKTENFQNLCKIWAVRWKEYSRRLKVNAPLDTLTQDNKMQIYS